MEPSYFSNTMQRGRERDRERPHAVINYTLPFSHADYKLILSPQDNYSKVQLLTQNYRVAHSMGSDTGLFYTFIFSPNTVNLHAGSDLSTRGLFPSPLPFFFTTIGRGPLSPLELNVGLFFYTVFRPICVPLLPFVSTG